MGYEASLKKAWGELQKKEKDKYQIKFLNNQYEIDLTQKRIFSTSSNIEAKDYYKILILHYLANEGRVQSIENDGWSSFREMEGGKSYFPAFRKRAMKPIIKKYGDNPSLILEHSNSLNLEKIDTGTVGVSMKVFPKIKVGIVLWEKDEEFEADCNILFSKGTKEILPTEDVAVLGGIVASLM